MDMYSIVIFFYLRRGCCNHWWGKEFGAWQLGAHKGWSWWSSCFQKTWSSKGSLVHPGETWMESIG
jgi:hypothetical protein